MFVIDPPTIMKENYPNFEQAVLAAETKVRCGVTEVKVYKLELIATIKTGKPVVETPNADSRNTETNRVEL